MTIELICDWEEEYGVLKDYLEEIKPYIQHKRIYPKCNMISSDTDHRGCCCGLDKLLEKLDE